MNPAAGTTRPPLRRRTNGETTTSRTARIREAARRDEGEAARLIAALLKEAFGLDARDIRVNRDQYSLNSLNGFFSAAGEAFFFKFHQEEGEEAMSGEYYRADLLAHEKLPVDLPVHVSRLPGEQILVYRRRSDPRFSDVLRDLDLAPDARREERAVAAQAALDDRIGAVYLRTWHPITRAEAMAEPIHRLFWERLVDPVTRKGPGGRLASFYVGRHFDFPGASLSWAEFSRLRFRVDGRLYERSVGELFTAALARLDPARLADAGGVTAHGDAHNANVWYEDDGDAARLVFFDPAFAGRNVPSLIAEVKATFHNCLAHPLWLYEPEEAAARFGATATRHGDILDVATDWEPTPLRRRLLEIKAERVWKPLLAELYRRGMLPADWQEVIRLALFLCPTLVMNLRAGAAGHDSISSLIGFATAVMVGSAPVDGDDLMTDFFRTIDPTPAGGRRRRS